MGIDTQGKGRGEGAVERNTSRPSESSSSKSNTSSGSSSVQKQVEETKNKIGGVMKKLSMLNTQKHTDSTLYLAVICLLSSPALLSTHRLLQKNIPSLYYYGTEKLNKNLFCCID